jgi:DNA-binding NtrC family response regulator
MIELTLEAQQLLAKYTWPGNIRQLKNVTEQINVLETGNTIDKDALLHYLPVIENQLPMLLGKIEGNFDGMSERDIFYKVLLDLKRDVNDLKSVVFGLLENNENGSVNINQSQKTEYTPTYQNYNTSGESRILPQGSVKPIEAIDNDEEFIEAETFPGHIENALSLEAKEIEMIRMALEKNNGKRKKAADDLGISERTLYRKIKQYELE